MSFIRIGQDSEHVNLGDDGSREYLYDDGHSIAGEGFYIDYGEWIGALCTHAELAGLDEGYIEKLERAMEDHYLVQRKDTNVIGPVAEMSHILAQHIDSRIDSLELTDDILSLLSEYAESAFEECGECGDEWRPSPPLTDHQDGHCRDCYHEGLMSMDVSCNTFDLREYIRGLPDDEAPTDSNDDEFYALTMDAFSEFSGEERNALAHKLGAAADEIQDAAVEERPVNKDMIYTILDEVESNE